LKTNEFTEGVLNRHPLTLHSARRVMTCCDKLARCSDSKTGITRTFLSPATDEAHELVAGWMREAGMMPHIDDIGNLIGHYPAQSDVPDGPVFLLGSHLDTVPNAGKYDGILGVLLAIEMVASLGGQKLPFAIEVVGFSEEEGVRYRTPYLGSRAMAGKFDESLLELVDQNGISMRRALRDFGLAPHQWPHAEIQAERVVGYLEAHIEQGPYLEAVDAPLGIVTAIAGQSRIRVRFSGQAGHAGTSPMTLRRDALTAASEWVLAVESLAQTTEELVATVGALEVIPNAANVVPGEVVCSLDLRHESDQERVSAVETLMDRGTAIAAKRGCEFEVLAHSRQPAVPMDEELRSILEGACEEMGIHAPLMVSGAGHDAAIIASVAPTAMLFLRTPGGASHCPEEAVTAEDVALALQAMRGFVLESAAKFERG
jgi:allantoate deiminase